MRMAILVVMMALPAWGQQCQTTFKTNNSARISFCITGNGNIENLEGPPGWNQIGTSEGYAVCALDESFKYWDLGGYGDSGNWNQATVNQPKGPNTFPFSITRQTADGRFTLTQTFKLVQAGKAVGVTMSLLGPQAQLRRFAEVMPQVNQSSDHTSVSAFVWSSSRDGLLATPNAAQDVSSGIVGGGAQDPCSPSGTNGNFAILLSWIMNPVKQTPAYFEYAPMR